VVLGRSFRDLARLDLGYAPDDVVSLRVAASGDEFRQTESFHTAVSKLRQSIADVPGVEAVAVMGPSLPTDMMNGARILSQEQWEKGGAAPTLIRIAYVSEQAFATLGIPILEGRDFDTRDMDADAQRVIGISKELADRLWPGQSALGRQIRLASGGNSWTVVNVVSSADLEGPLPSPSGGPLAYFPIYQTSSRWTPVINIIAHGRHGGTAALGERIRGIMKRELPGVEAYDAALIRDRIRQQTGPGRLLVLLVGAFAGIAAVIAVLGTYAAFAQLLGHHTREFGLRLALGSSPREIMFLAFRRGMTPGIIGAAAGCVGTLFLGSVMPAAATWVAPTRLADIALAAVLVLAGVVVAGLQARRAGRVDPVETLGAG
jgi:putative ABC transport system permease protein